MRSNKSANKTHRVGPRIVKTGCLLLVVAAGWAVGQQLLRLSSERDTPASAKAGNASHQQTVADEPLLAAAIPGAESAVVEVVDPAVIPNAAGEGVPPIDTLVVLEPGADGPQRDTQWAGFGFEHWLNLASASREADSTAQTAGGSADDAGSPSRQVTTFLSRSDLAAGREASPNTPSSNPPSDEPGVSSETSPPTPSDEPAADEPDEPVDPLAALREQYVNRLVSFYPIGWSSDDPQLRHVGWGISSGGWEGFLKQHILPDLAWGYRRIQLHNPFGDDGVWPMELDQALRADAGGDDWLTAGFVDAWQPVTRGDYTDGEPVEVIAYMGTARLTEFLDLEATGDWDGWLARAEASVALPVAAGMTLAFDSFSLEAEDSFSHRFTELMKARGIKVYIETWPKREAAHWHGTNVVVAEEWFMRNHQNDNVARRSDLTGEVLRLMNKLIDETENSDATKLRVIEGLLHGYTVSLRSDRMADAVTDLETLLREVGSYSNAAYD